MFIVREDKNKKNYQNSEMGSGDWHQEVRALTNFPILGWGYFILVLFCKINAL